MTECDAHVWEGEYAKAFEGAYFARHLEQARQEGRICRVAVDPVLPVKAFFDIGGAGHSSDAMAIWIAQFVGREIRLLDYIEGVGQPLGYYAHEMRRRGWSDVIVYGGWDFGRLRLFLCYAREWRLEQSCFDVPKLIHLRISR